MYGQGNYAPQFRHGSPAPPLPFQAPPPAGPQPSFQQASLTGTPPPPPLQGPQHQAANQVPHAPPPPPVYPHGLTPSSSSIHHPPPVIVNMPQPYMHLNPPASSNYGTAPAAHSYAQQIQAGVPYPPPVGSQSVNHIPPPAFPPPRGLPPTGVSSQGQSLYRTPHPPPPGIQHVPTPPPPPPSSFVTITPAPFTPFVHGSVSEAHPPSLPPPPPPPPPSSPPPLPSSPPPPSSEGEELPIVDSGEMRDHTVVKDHYPDKIINESGDAACLIGGVLIHSGDSGGDVNGESFANKEEPPAHFSPPPPRPADKVVHNIEALCRFMANVGPHFENLARAKEVGNPHFSFLFGGEPGSAAAVGYEYFQWMKKKCRLEVGSCDRPTQIMLSQTPTEPQSPIEESKPSPAESDMDMDDDAGQPERRQGIAELIKETSKETLSQGIIEEQFNAHPNMSQEGVHEVSVLRGVSSSESSFHNLQKHAVATEAPKGPSAVNVQQSMGSAFEDATSVGVLSSHSDGSNMEVPRIFVKDGSPFRHIQGYASDDSVEDNRKESITQAFSGEVLSVTRHDTSYENEGTDSYSALDPKGTIDTEKNSQSHIESAEIHLEDMPSGLGGSLASHDEASPATTSFGLLHGIGSADGSENHQKDDPTMYAEKGTSRVSSCSDIAEANKDSVGQQVVKFCQEKCVLKDSKPQVDEFGRMIREDASSSDSEEMPYERHGRRGKSRSKSPSPQQSRRRSRSPWRWRGKQSPSQSPSPRRQSRSRSPPLPRRMGERARRNHAQPPVCVHFLRGQCYRGASCWFLHSDSRRNRNRPQDRQDVSQGSDKYVRTVHDSRNIIKESADAQQESLRLEEEIQELEPETELCSVSMKDEALAGAGTLDSINDDAEHLIPHEEDVKKDSGEMDKESGSHQSPNLLQETQHAEPEQPTVDTPLAEGEDAQKTLDGSRPLADANLGDQTLSVSEAQHLLGEGHLGQPSGEVLDNQAHAHPHFSVPIPQSEHQNVSSSQHMPVGPPVSQLSSTQPMQSSPSQNQMPTAQLYAGEIPVSESHPKPSLMDPSFPNQDPGLSHFAPQSSSFTGGDLNNNFSQIQAPFQGLPPHVASVNQMQLESPQGHPPQYQAYAPQPPRENWAQMPRTSFLSQPSPADVFPPNRPSLYGSYHSLNAPPKPAWADFPPPSYGKEAVMHPIPSMNSHPQFQQIDGPLGSEFISHTGARLHQVFHPGEQQKHVSELVQRPLPGGTQQNQTFGGPNLTREKQHYLRHPVTDGRQLASSFQPLPPINKEGPFPTPGFNIQLQNHRSFLRDEFHASTGGMSYSQPASHGLQRPTSSNFSSNMGEAGSIGPSLRHPLSIPECLSDVGLPKIVVPTHYNPFAYTFEQSSTSSKYVSNVFGQDGSSSFGNKYVSSFGSDHKLMGGHGSTKLATSPLSAGGTDVAFLAKPGDRSYPWQQSVEDIVQKQFRKEPPVGDQYDPLFDSIEPSSKISKKLSSLQEQDPMVHDADIASSVHVPADVEENNKQKVGPTVASKIENDEFGETAPDAEVGAVENESPVLVDGRDWSPAFPVDLPDKVMGEIEIDQVRSPGRSKKSKDSRSMKHFKIALANFVKEVLKPSWRQGNMSKEAFKTIVKKTVDKVSSSVSRHQIPKSQAKINQYVESSQRKLTKLVMGYVDKYVKM